MRRCPSLPPAMVEKIQRTILQPAVDGLREEGRPFVGVLYAGMMLTAHGPKVIEFNCRFGDPETQAILPLLESDLLEILMPARPDDWPKWTSAGARARRRAWSWRRRVIPGNIPPGGPISGLETTRPDSFVFHAGTKEQDGQIVTSGGRVLGVTGWGENIPQALKSAYAAIGPIRFEGMQYRKDIGRAWRSRERLDA